MKRRARSPAPRAAGELTLVEVLDTAAPIDIDRWADRYLAAILEAEGMQVPPPAPGDDA